MYLKGKNALVTGSSRGLGKQYAFDLAKAGANVIVHDITEDAASEFNEAASGHEVAKEIRSLGVTSEFFAGDLSDPLQAANVVEKAIERLGTIDILVNNAGGDIGFSTPRPNPNDALDISVEDIRSVVDRNLLTTMYMCKYVGLHMKERKSGKIINVGSIAGHIPVKEGIIYATAKAGISYYTRSLAEQLRPYNVNVNAISPAPTYTGRFLATRTVQKEEGKPRLQKIAHPEDMSGIVMFLCGPSADILTGETIVCWV
ncbi:SDR family NAD(P)-dependent oxidoreductase [Lederbergia panacisoli]|uniref:SDR family NAD(P)-dependent oxidoreductase n=1 Tax=Lederbergia panacisoli TaxID=1255251 RepID=UPI00214BFFA4|nr:SDR family oxidoreductase [Lederbergia panacisoli]MCR2822959.1 SDR family oxidoreductase [Lederbergia panacisoli]